MPGKKSKNKSKDKKTTLEELIVRSHVVRKNIDTIMSAFKKIEKYLNEMQGSLNERRARQQSMSHRLEQLIKEIKELDNNIKEKTD